MAVTMKQIAQRIGLSVPTVSLVLNHKPHPLREETRQLVLKAAREMGYRPNGFARAVRQGRFGMVTVVLRCGEHADGALPGPLQQGLLAGVRAHDLQLMLAELPEMPVPADADGGDDPHLPRLLRELSSDGLLFLPRRGCQERMEALVAQHRLPAVWIGQRRLTDCVYADARAAGRRAARHLLDLGHQRIAWLSLGETDPASADAREQYEGYAEAMTASGQAPRLLMSEAPVGRGQQVQVVEQWLAAPADAPTAVVIDSTQAAAAVMVAAARLGLEVPRDLSVVLVGEDGAGLPGPGLTSLRAPLEKVGEAAVEALTRRIANPAADLPAVSVPYEFAAGETCAPPAELRGERTASRGRTADPVRSASPENGKPRARPRGVTANPA